MKQATLHGPNGAKKVVDAGSQQASDLMKQGWGLTTGSYKDPTVVDSGNLKGTLPSTPDVNTPFGQVNQLDALQMMMKKTGAVIQKQGLLKGVQTAGTTLKATTGVSTSFGPGGDFLGNLISFVDSHVNQPTRDTFQSASEMIASVASQSAKVQDDSRSQINQMMANGQWDRLKDTERQTLWKSAGYQGPAMTLDQNLPAFEHVTDADGNVWNVQYDPKTGAIISKTNFGPVGVQKTSGGGGGGTGTGGLASAAKKGYTLKHNDVGGVTFMFKGTPITPQEFEAKTGMSYLDALAAFGTNDQGDVKKLKNAGLIADTVPKREDLTAQDQADINTWNYKLKHNTATIDDVPDYLRAYITVS